MLLNQGHGKPVDWWTLGVLLYDIAYLDGVDLETAIRAKMKINQGRTWGIDPTTGLLNHTNVEDNPTAKCAHCEHLNTTIQGVNHVRKGQ